MCYTHGQSTSTIGVGQTGISTCGSSAFPSCSRPSLACSEAALREAEPLGSAAPGIPGGYVVTWSSDGFSNLSSLNNTISTAGAPTEAPTESSALVPGGSIRYRFRSRAAGHRAVRVPSCLVGARTAETGGTSRLQGHVSNHEANSDKRRRACGTRYPALSHDRAGGGVGHTRGVSGSPMRRRRCRDTGFRSERPLSPHVPPVDDVNMT